MLAAHLAQKKEKEKKKQETRLPIILNLCLYSGKKTPYPYSVDIYDCFEDHILARAELFKPLPLIDLGQIEEEELAQHGTADLLEMLLKQSQKRTFLRWMQNNPEAMRKLLVRFYGISGIMYILGVEQEYSPEEVLQTIESIVPQRKEDIMTAAQQLGEKYEQRGIQQGMQIKALEIAENMLSELHLDVETVAQATGLSREELIKIQEETSQ